MVLVTSTVVTVAVSYEMGPTWVPGVATVLAGMLKSCVGAAVDPPAACDTSFFSNIFARFILILFPRVRIALLS